MQHRLHGQTFGVSVAARGVLGGALEGMVPAVAVPRLHVAGHAHRLAIQIDLDRAGLAPQSQHRLRQPDRDAADAGARLPRLRLRLRPVAGLVLRRHRREQRRHRAHEQIGIARSDHHVLAALGAAQHIDGLPGPHERLRAAVDPHLVAAGRRVRRLRAA